VKILRNKKVQNLPTLSVPVHTFYLFFRLSNLKPFFFLKWFTTFFTTEMTKNWWDRVVFGVDLGVDLRLNWGHSRGISTLSRTSCRNIEQYYCASIQPTVPIFGMNPWFTTFFLHLFGVAATCNNFALFSANLALLVCCVT
jgi:hypothetical protein